MDKVDRGILPRAFLNRPGSLLLSSTEIEAFEPYINPGRAATVFRNLMAAHTLRLPFALSYELRRCSFSYLYEVVGLFLNPLVINKG